MMNLKNRKDPSHSNPAGSCKGHAHGKEGISQSPEIAYHHIHHATKEIGRSNDRNTDESIPDDFRIG